jgi:hypothetical protein
MIPAGGSCGPEAEADWAAIGCVTVDNDRIAAAANKSIRLWTQGDRFTAFVIVGPFSALESAI